MTTKETKTPVLLDIHSTVVDYLNRLRNTGVINMYSAAPYLQRDFDIDIKQAIDISIAYVTGNFKRK